MIYEQPLFLFDATAVITMLVFAYLSSRLGAAMRIRSYYIVLFFTSGAIVAAAGFETIPQSLNYESISIVTNSIRLAASVAAFAVVLRYWKWLFAEFSKK